MSSLSQLLTNASSPDTNLREAANKQLEQVLQTPDEQLPSVFQALCTEIATTQLPSAARAMAILMMKASLTATSTQEKMHKMQRWFMYDETVRGGVRTTALQCLNDSEAAVRSNGASLVAAIAAIDLPHKHWLELPEIIIRYVNESDNVLLKISGLTTLGYVCETAASCLTAYSSAILNCISVAIQPNQPDNLRLAATTCLNNAMDYIGNNMSNSAEKNVIMDMTYASLESSNSHIRLIAVQCVIKLVVLYYEAVCVYAPRLLQITTNIIDRDDEEVALQAIEVWSSFADSEIDILSYNASLGGNTASQLAYHGVIEQAAPHLIPVLLRTLPRVEAEPDEDEINAWNLKSASATCLSLLTECLGAKMVQFVYPFIREHVGNSDWRLRDAAILVYGSIITESTKTALLPEIPNTFMSIVGLLKDPVVDVQDSAAWTLGRICDVFPEGLSEQHADILVQAFEYGIAQKESIACHMCYSLHAYFENAMSNNLPLAGMILNKKFADLMGSLLALVDKAQLQNTESVATECLVSLVRYALHTQVPENMELLKRLFVEIIQRSTRIVQNTDARMQSRLGMFCTVLCTVLDGMDDAYILTVGKSVMEMCVQVFNVPSSSAHEEALFLIGVIARKTGQQFVVYMTFVKPVVVTALGMYSDKGLVSAAVDLVSDLAAALGSYIYAFCDDFVQGLLHCLQCADLDREVKLKAVLCFADIALAIGDVFERYTVFVLQVLGHANGYQYDPANEDDVSYALTLWSNVLETYSTILTVLHQFGKAKAYLPFVQQTLQLARLVCTNEGRSADNMAVAFACCGDVIRCLGPDVHANILQLRVNLNGWLNEGMGSIDPMCKQNAVYLNELVRKLLA